jgi:hypothetical protein
VAVPRSCKTPILLPSPEVKLNVVTLAVPTPKPRIGTNEVIAPVAVSVELVDVLPDEVTVLAGGVVLVVVETGVVVVPEAAPAVEAGDAIAKLNAAPVADKLKLDGRFAAST